MFWFLPLAAAAAGALADKENPLRGAALGAGIGMTGGAAAGGLLGAGAGAGAAGAGAAGAAGAGAAGTAGGAGLLGGATGAGTAAGATGATNGLLTASGVGAGTGAGTTAATQTAGLLGVPGATSGAGSQAAMLAAQNHGFGAIGQQLTGQAAGTASGVAVPNSVNLAAGVERFGEMYGKAKPMLDATQTGIQVANAFQDQPQTPPQVMQNSGGPQTLAQLYQDVQQGAQPKIAEETEMRKARRRGLLGGM